MTTVARSTPWHAARILALVAALAPHVASASPANDGVSVIERLGQPVDRALAFVDDRGRTVRLGSFIGDGRPLLLTLNYFRCRTLCDLQLQRLAYSLRALDTVPGERFRLLTISIDPTDSVAAAAERRSGYLRQTGREDLDWRFAIGAEPQLRALAAELGFGYRYDERTRQYAHAPMLFLISPDGRIVRYLYGIDQPPGVLRLALVDASAGRIGHALDKLILSCFQFEPAAGRYGVYVLGVVRAGGVLTVIGLLLGFVVLRRRELRRS